MLLNPATAVAGQMARRGFAGNCLMRVETVNWPKGALGRGRDPKGELLIWNFKAE